MLLSRLKRLLPSSCRAAAEALMKSGPVPLYLVGGPVRDLLLGEKILDLDVAVEAPLDALAPRLAALGGRLTIYERFGTGKIELKGGGVVDLATTRRETYPEPARLPVVEPGAGIVEDMARRDFAINAMALRLNGSDAGRLVDPFRGQDDLKNRTIRILHPDSFRDDPVRAFRAVRYAARYKFKFEEITSGAMADLLKHPELLLVASDRIFDEWRRAFEEARWPECLRRTPPSLFQRWLGSKVAADPKFCRAVDAGFKRISKFYPNLPLWAARCAASLFALPAGPRARIAARMPFPRQIKKIFSAPFTPARTVKALGAKCVRPSDVFRLLSGLPPEWLPAIFAASGLAGRSNVGMFAGKWRKVSPPATGDDLQKAGIPPGPAYPKILAALHAAKLDGRIKSASDLQEAIAENL
ncbi:CCA tRNA nucleotidyltransferase [bacterium]|nr:CCA tRNA nucleotidyltransferase [bacterium]